MDGDKLILNGVQVAWVNLLTLNAGGEIDSLSAPNKLKFSMLGDSKIVFPTPSSAATAGVVTIKTNTNIDYQIAATKKTIDFNTGDEVAAGTNASATVITLVLQECDSATVLQIQEHTGPIQVVAGYGKKADGTVDTYISIIGDRTKAIEINGKQDTPMQITLEVTSAAKTASTAGKTAIEYTPSAIHPDGDLSYNHAGITSGNVDEILSGKYLELAAA